MAVSISFHRNVFLLNQLVPPDNNFEKVFRKGMFDKPNTVGFIHVSHYLLTIYNAERFQKLIEWPVVCKKTENKYRNTIKDYLNIIALENPDMEFPRVVTTYLYHASGTKFITIMWKLSQLVLRTYIKRNGEYNTVFPPKKGLASDLGKTYLQQLKSNVSCDILGHHRNYMQMEKVANSALAEEKEYLAKIKTELFDKKQSLSKHVSAVSVDKFVKQRLINVEDIEIISMWKNSLNENIQDIQKMNAMLMDLKQICENINGIILNLLNDTKVLNGKQLEKINCSLLSDLPFPLSIQHYLYHLYNDDNLVYHNFIHLLTLVLYQIYQCLKKEDLIDLSQCLLQLEMSAADMKSMCNIFKTFMTRITDSTEKTQNVLHITNIEHISEELPFVKSILFMPSPLIKINTNYADGRNNTQLLQFTPNEATHKSLFSRYIRHKQNYTPDLKTNLFVSRINFDTSLLLDSNEKQGLTMRFTSPKVKQLCKRTAGKYSRLFSTHVNKNIKVNSSIISLPCTTQANSSVIANTLGETPSSDFNLNSIAKGLFNLSEECLQTSCTSVEFTPPRRNVSIISQQQKNKFNHKVKPELDEITEIQFVNDNDEDNIVRVKHKNNVRRQSISDLVERYRNLLETSNSITAKLENKYMENNIQ